MTGFGQNLRREREMRGISLDDMAESTKIGTRLLKALEDEQFDLLPGGIFNKGFVRAYAKYLGIDEEGAVSSYLEAAGQQEMDVRLIAEQNSKWDKRNSALDTPRIDSGGFPLVPVLILVLVVAAGFGGWRMYQQRQQEKHPAQTAESPANSSQPAGTNSENRANTSNEPAGIPAPSRSGGSPNTASSATSSAPSDSKSKEASGLGSPFANPSITKEEKPVAGGPFEVSIHTKDRAWVSIKIDGDISTRGVLPADQTRTFHANQQVVLWTGNAGAVEVAYNGKSVPLEGGPNEVKVLVFTPTGVAPGVIPKPRPATNAPQQPVTPNAEQPANAPPQPETPETKPPGEP